MATQKGGWGAGKLASAGDPKDCTGGVGGGALHEVRVFGCPKKAGAASPGNGKVCGPGPCVHVFSGISVKWVLFYHWC